MASKRRVNPETGVIEETHRSWGVDWWVPVNDWEPDNGSSGGSDYGGGGPNLLGWLFMMPWYLYLPLSVFWWSAMPYMVEAAGEQWPYWPAVSDAPYGVGWTLTTEGWLFALNLAISLYTLPGAFASILAMCVVAIAVSVVALVVLLVWMAISALAGWS